MYVESLNDVRTKLGTGFNILERAGGWCKPAWTSLNSPRSRISEPEVRDSELLP